MEQSTILRYTILIRYGEIHLKGLNRPYFIQMLKKQIKHALYGMDNKIFSENARFYVEVFNPEDYETAQEKLCKVFGIHSISPVLVTEKNWEKIVETASLLMGKEAGEHSFKVFARRADKRFPMTSDTICRELGHEILERYPLLTVDVHNPEIKLGVEIRDEAYLYTKELQGAGGLPVGTAGRAALLLSGGIDSPVAGHMLSKRGITLSAVHFESFPYTSERAKIKVIDLAKIMSRYCGEIRLHIVRFTDIQMAIHEYCPEKETTLLMRRLMMKIAEKIARADDAKALITGESLGQVASQTLESLCVTDDAVSMPVFRPLIGMDKTEIIERARQIGTFETSILPYEDCCTVFVPKHPTTKPKVSHLIESEALFDFSDMIEAAITGSELHVIK